MRKEISVLDSGVVHTDANMVMLFIELMKVLLDMRPNEYDVRETPEKVRMITHRRFGLSRFGLGATI